jgi:hypothetical protein
MPFSHWLTVAALASLPLAATAQQTRQDPTDANAAVPTSAYKSAFTGYRAAADQQESPDKLWRGVNEEMQRLGGHAGHMKDADTATPTSAPKADIYQGHNNKGR